MNRKFLIITFFTISLFSCTRPTETINGLTVQEYSLIVNGNTEFKHKTKFVDNQNKFSIDYPTNWAPTESLQGVVAADTGVKLEDAMIIGVSRHLFEAPNLNTYFKQELNNLTTDSCFKAYRIGKHKVNTYDAYWVLYEMTCDDIGNHRSFLNYIKGQKENEFYLIDVNFYNPDDLDKKISKSLEIINTFSLIN